MRNESYPRVLLAGLVAVAASSLLLALLTLYDAWGRPVSAVSDIPGRSAIVARSSGLVTNAAAAKYAADLRSGDRLIAYDGLPWEHAQRLNLHERTTHQPGDTIPLVVQRGDQRLLTQTRVLLPDGWEQMVLLRLAFSGLVCWLAATLVLVVWVRHERRSPTPFAPSTVPLWFLVWQMVSIAQSMGSLKYPAATMWTPVLFGVMQMLVALVSLPFPLAPPALRPRWLVRGLVLLALASASAIVWHSLRSPFPSTDWRRAVQLLSTNDIVWQVTLLAGLCGVLLAAIGMLATALSVTIRRVLRAAARVLPRRPQARCLQALAWIEQTYLQCPPAIVVISQFQALVVLLYLLFDRVPTALGGSGSGFSVLLALIPFSYLLLYSDVRAQALGHRFGRLLVGAVLLLQGSSLVYRLWNGTYGAGANTFDYATIATLTLGSLGGGVYLALDQRRRQRTAVAPEHVAFARLFAATNPDAFWNTLVTHVGAALGVQTWMWVRTDDAGVWHIYRCTSTAHGAWLTNPSVDAALRPRELLYPVSLTVDADTLPSTLIVFPIPNEDRVRVTEAFIAANPRRIQDSLRLLDNALVYAPLVNALQTLHLVAQQQRLLLAYQRLAQQERDEMRALGLQIIADLHDDALDKLRRRISTLRQLRAATLHGVPALERSVGIIESDDLELTFDKLIGDLEAINKQIKQSLKDLCLRVVKEELHATLDDLIQMFKRQQGGTVRFSYNPPAAEPPLTAQQREIIWWIVKEAITNALKHAAPERIVVELWQADGLLHVVVRDNGRGFAPAALNPESASIGTLLMPSLARQINSDLDVHSAPGRGCAVRLRVPLREGV